MSERKPPRRRHSPQTRTVETVRKNNLDKSSGVEVTSENVSNIHPESINNPAHVSVMGKITRNLGDFNSAQVSVGITLPCVATPEAIEKTYQTCTAWVEKKIEQELEKV